MCVSQSRILMRQALLPLSLLVLSAACVADAPGADATLSITFHGVQGSEGKILAAIYDDPAEFRKDGDSVAWLVVPAGTRKLTLSDFPTGRFAISAFHDENGNNDLDLEDGLPSEGYGHSGRAGKWDEPTFEDAAFEGRSVSVRFHYLP